MIRLTTLTVLWLLVVPLYGQNVDQWVVSTAGNHFSNSSHQVSFTIGELAISTLSSSGSVLTQGFHQPVLHVTSQKEFEDNFLVSVFPNPVSESLTIMDEAMESTIQLYLYSSTGKLYYKGELMKNERKEINMSPFPKGSYILVISGGDSQHQNYSIVKTN